MEPMQTTISGERGRAVALGAAIAVSSLTHFALGSVLLMATTLLPLLWFVVPLSFVVASAAGTAVFKRLRPSTSSDSRVWLFVLLLFVLLIFSVAVANLVVTGVEL